MATVQVAELTTTATQPSTVQVAELFARAGVYSTVQVAEIGASVGAAAKVQVAELDLVAAVTNTLSARPTPAQSVTAFTDVVLDGRASTGTPTTYRWVQIPNGAPMQPDLPSDSDVLTYRPVPALQTYTAVFELTVSNGTQTASARRSDTVYAWSYWELRAGAWVATPRYRITNAPTYVPPFVSVTTPVSVSTGAAATLTMSAGDTDGFVTAYRWQPRSWPATTVPPVLLTPNQPTTLTTPLTVAGTYTFEAQATDGTNLLSPVAVATVNVS